MKTGFNRVAVFAIFAATLVLVTKNFAASAPKVASVKLNGLYRAFPAVPQFGAAIGDAYVFSANGDVYRGWIGTQSPEAFNFARARTKKPANTGKYVASGDTITFRWSNKQSETASFRYTRNASGKITMSIGSSFCNKIVPWDKMLNGTFSPATYQGGFADLKPQVPAIVDKISFTRDGQFTITADDDTTTKGRYKVSGAALTLVLPDGETRAYSLHVFADGRTPPTTVLIDGRPFNKP